MFSARTPVSLAPNRLTSSAESRRRAGLPILDLTLSNPTRCGLPLPSDEILAPLLDPRALTYEPEPQGRLSAREAVAAHHARHGAQLHPSRLFLAASTSEAYSWTFKLLCDPGDEVLVPHPSYPLFDCLASLESVAIRPYPLLPELGWAIDRAALEARLTPRSRAILLVNPNHPAGSYVHPEDFHYLAKLAARRGLALVCDEVFFDYRLHEPSPLSALQLESDALVLTLSGLSKIAGLPQMKLGWLHAGGPPALAAEACARLEWIADTYLPVSAPVQFAAPAWLALAPRIQDAILDRCRASLAACAAALPPAGPVRLLPPGGGWSALLLGPRQVPGEDLSLALLDRCGLLTQPGYFYDFPADGFLALSLLTPPAEAGPAARQIAELWSESSSFPAESRYLK